MTLREPFRRASIGLTCLSLGMAAPCAAFDPADVPTDYRGTFVSCMAKGEVDPVSALDYAEQWLISDLGGEAYGFYCLAIATFQTGEPVRAAELLEDLAEHPAVRDTPDAVRFYRLAGDFFDGGGAPERAFRVLSKALDRARFDPSLWIDRALIRASLGDFEGTIADLDLALALDPDNVDALVFRGSGFLAVRDYDRAADDALQALLLEPFSLTALWLRAQVALAEGDRQLAIADLERITARDDGMLAERAREALRVLKNADQKSTLE